jgi:hypothetical protein
MSRGISPAQESEGAEEIEEVRLLTVARLIVGKIKFESSP